MDLQDIIDNIVVKKAGKYLETENAFFFTGELLFKVEARFDEVNEEKDLPFIKQQLAEILYKAIYKQDDCSIDQQQLDFLYDQLKEKEQARINMVSELEYLRQRVKILENQQHE